MEDYQWNSYGLTSGSTQGQCLHEKWPWLHRLPQRMWVGRPSPCSLCSSPHLDGGHGLIEVKSTPYSWWPTQSYRHSFQIQVCLVFPGQVSERDTGHLGSGFAHILFNSIICICFGGGGWYLFFFFFWQCWVFAALCMLSSCGKQELLYNCSVYASSGGFSCYTAWAQ